jgi:hypothetical protein
MALSTTQSIWRSGGGDQTRTAYCGSGVMVAQFYIADATPATAIGSVTVSSAAGAPALILPSGAVVLSISVSSDTGSGSAVIGSVGYTSGTANSQIGLISLAKSTSPIGTGVGSFVSGTPLTEMSYVTVSDDDSAVGPASGYITYFVTDPLLGQQNV